MCFELLEVMTIYVLFPYFSYFFIDLISLRCLGVDAKPYFFRKLLLIIAVDYTLRASIFL